MVAGSIPSGNSPNLRSFLRGRQRVESKGYILTGSAHQVLSEFVQKGDMSKRQVIEVTKKALFENANRDYSLGLESVLEGMMWVQGIDVRKKP